MRATEGDRPLAGAAATLDLDMAGMHHGLNRIVLHERAAGVYEGTGVLVMPGPWLATARLTRRGESLMAVFRFRAPH